MATNKIIQVVLNSVASKIDTFDQSHDTVDLTWTATMQHGSLLLDTNLEAAAADAATVTQVIDMPSLIENDYTVGEVVQVNVAARNCVFHSEALTYSDTDVVDTALLTALAAKANTFRSITNG